MPEFLTLLPPQEALVKFFSEIEFSPKTEIIAVADGLGRVLAAPIRATFPLPAFRRSAVDGYAVRAADTFGASESLPAYLELAGEVPMGAMPHFSIQPGQCATIHTGGALPEGADAVIMVEYTQQARRNEVELLRSVADGENVLKIGEDVQSGQEVLSPGAIIRPAEIGGLSAFGILEIEVAKKPVVGIISSGDEVRPPGVKLESGQVYDINSYTLRALVEQNGGAATLYGIVPDKRDVMEEVVRRAYTESDLVLVTAGSSASARDLTSEVIDALGKPGVLVHGVNVRPGKPTILGVCNGKPVIGLPGNPVSALVIAGLFVVPVIERMLGKRQTISSVIPATLAVNVASQAGREDWVAVKVVEAEQGMIAEPIFGKSNLIYTLARANGLVRVPADANGISAGEVVQVWLF